MATGVSLVTNPDGTRSVAPAATNAPNPQLAQQQSTAGLGYGNVGLPVGSYAPGTAPQNPTVQPIPGYTAPQLSGQGLGSIASNIGALGGALGAWGGQVANTAAGNATANYDAKYAATQDPYSYGGTYGGPGQWTGYYTGLGQTALAQAQASAQQQQAQAMAQASGIYGTGVNLGTGYGQLSTDAGNAAIAGANQGGALATGGLGNLAGAYGGQAGAGFGATQQGLGMLGGAAGQYGQQALGAYGYGQQGLGLLASAAEGNGPSAAQAQLGAGTAQAIRAQLAAGAAARGGPFAQAEAQNAALGQAAGMEGAAVGQSAQVRAQEQQAAQAALVQGAGQQYGTAAGAQGQALGAYQAGAGQQYGTAAGIQSAAQQAQAQAALQQAQMSGNFGLQGAQQAGQMALQGYGTGAGAYGQLYGIGAQQGIGYATLGAQQEQAYQQAAQNVNQDQLNAQVTKAGINAGVSEAGAQQATQFAGAGLSALGTIFGAASAALDQPNPVQLQGAPPLGTTLQGTPQYSVATSPYGDTRNAYYSDENVKSDVTPQGGASPGAGGASAGQAAGQAASDAANAANASGTAAQDAYKAKLMGMLQQFRASMAPLTQAAPTVRPYAPQMAAASQFASPIMSDERAKLDVARAPTADAYLDTLARSQSTFAYRDPSQQPVGPMHPHLPGARYGGVMAQDLERVPEIGRQLVTDTPRGKVLEPGAVQGAQLMGLGRLAERVKALEATHGAR